MAGNLDEIGRSGLLIPGGLVQDEFIPQLRGPQGRRTYREMSDNDPVIGGFLLAFEKMLARLPWHIQAPQDASPDDDAIADFVQECFEDMEDDWPSTLSSLMSMLVYGWSFHEIVYKIRGGRKTTDPKRQSKFDDGKVGWRKWPIRSQESLLRWELQDNDSDQIVAMTQFVYDAGTLTIPLDKALLFRTTLNRNSPEGRSLLRNAYRPWYFKKRIEEIEAVGIERDLAGLPVAWMDPLYFSDQATAQETALKDAVANIVRNIKRNEQEGILFPLARDEKGNKTIELTLMSTGGQRQFDTDKIITRYSQQIAMSVLADFLMLGHEKTGTQALGTSKLELWMLATEALAVSIASVVNQYAIPRLLKLNGMDAENPPELVFGSVSSVDFGELGTFLKNLVDSGILVPDRMLEEHVRELADLPPIDDETRDDMGTGRVAVGANDLAAMMRGAQQVDIKSQEPMLFGDKVPPQLASAVQPSPQEQAGMKGSSAFAKPQAEPNVEPGTNPEKNAEKPVPKKKSGTGQNANA